MTIELDESKPTIHVYGRVQTREQRIVVAAMLRDLARVIEDGTLDGYVAEHSTIRDDPKTMPIGASYGFGGFVSLAFEPKVTIVSEVTK
jgi:hypothetical protein